MPDIKVKPVQLNLSLNTDEQVAIHKNYRKYVTTVNIAIGEKILSIGMWAKAILAGK